MKTRSLYRRSRSLALALTAIVSCVATTYAQSTNFTYQGRLTDDGTAANGNYDLQFSLWDTLSSGNQVGSTQTLCRQSKSNRPKFNNNEN